MTEKKETVEQQIENKIAEIKAKYPEAKLFRISLSSLPNRLFIARKGSWSEFKRFLNQKGAGMAAEAIVSNFLIYPEWDGEEVDVNIEKWPAGLIPELSRAILSENEFDKGEVSIKKL